MSDSVTRREVIRAGALALTAAGTGALVPGPISQRLGTTVHAAVQQSGARGGYVPQAFLEAEWRTLRLLAETILPADDRSGGALEAGAPEFIDLLASHNGELQRILTSGILWLDHEMRRRTGRDFADAEAGDRNALLDRLAAGVEKADPGYESYAESIEYAGFRHYTAEPGDELGAGVRFFSWLRRLVVDAFYTSPVGVADLGYQGNEVLRRFEVAEESIRYAFERSPFRRP